jgi:hypothetical protein
MRRYDLGCELGVDIVLSVMLEGRNHESKS